jgi:hypothetical protein
MNPTTAFEMPQDCFNIVKDYMGIVSVPTPVWNELMKISLKDLKQNHNSIPYHKPFPKGTDLRKVSKKNKLQRYWCGAIKNKVNWNIYDENYGICADLSVVNYWRKQGDNPKRELTLKELRSDFATKARIFHKICIEGHVEDGHTYVKPMPHLWGNFQATDLSIVVCMMLMKEVYAPLWIDKICLGCDDREIFDSITTYEKRKKIDYHVQKKVKVCTWVNDFNVNEEVVVYHNDTPYSSIYRKAIVKKINKASVSVLLAMYREEYDINDTGYNRLIWGGWCLKTIPIKSRSKIYKKGDGWKYDEYIIEGQRRVDYGY